MKRFWSAVEIGSPRAHSVIGVHSCTKCIRAGWKSGIPAHILHSDKSSMIHWVFCQTCGGGRG